MMELAAHGDVALMYEIVVSHERDGNWTAIIQKLNVRMSGATDIEARSKAQAHALRAIANQIETDRLAPDQISFAVCLG
jgi:hypothetical protein